MTHILLAHVNRRDEKQVRLGFLVQAVAQRRAPIQTVQGTDDVRYNDHLLTRDITGETTTHTNSDHM